MQVSVICQKQRSKQGPEDRVTMEFHSRNSHLARSPEIWQARSIRPAEA
jgi:hypothetical protein